MEKTVQEKWIKVKGFEHYEVSNLGRVRKISYLRQNKAKKSSYIFVQLFEGDGHGKRSKKGRGKIKKVNLHRLVAEHFLPNPDGLLVVNHKDCDKMNNNATNLEWCTHSQNVQHAYDNGQMLALKGPQSGKRVKQIMGGEVIRIWNGVREAAEAGFTKAKVYGALGQGHMYRGCHWQYTDDRVDYETGQVFKFENGKRIPATLADYLAYTQPSPLNQEK